MSPEQLGLPYGEQKRPEAVPEKIETEEDRLKKAISNFIDDEAKAQRSRLKKEENVDYATIQQLAEEFAKERKIDNTGDKYFQVGKLFAAMLEKEKGYKLSQMAKEIFYKDGDITWKGKRGGDLGRAPIDVAPDTSAKKDKKTSPKKPRQHKPKTPIEDTSGIFKSLPEEDKKL